MRPRSALIVAALVLVAAAASLTRILAVGYTRLELVEEGTGRPILSTVLSAGAPVVLTWRNSLFDLDVIEEFAARNGGLVQEKVTFADPRGLPAPEVAPADVADLYHTGGPFTVCGLNVAVARVVYRVSEAGNPKLQVGDKVVIFKQEVGFGGAVVLTASAATIYDIFP